MSIFTGRGAYDVTQTLIGNAAMSARLLSEEQILSLDIDTFVERAIANAMPEMPVLDPDNITAERISNKSQSSYSTDTHYLAISVPFTGDERVFQFEPTRRRMNGLPFDVQGNELVFRASVDDSRAREKFDEELKAVGEHLAQLRHDIQHVPEQIRNDVTDIIVTRRRALEGASRAVESLGFKIRRRDEAPATYVTPVVQRKVVPPSAPKVSSAKPEPILDEAEYQHVLKVMDNMTHVMERSPKVFKTLGEEDIRTHFLIQLNGQYEGQATGETFNNEGKTDILIRTEDRNIFVGECKFWGGEKLLGETIDQLLGYLTWRDAKTALVIFNRNKGLTAMIATAVEAVKKHPNYKRGPQKESETRYRYVLRNKNDPDKEVVMTLMIYDIPS
jgi:hypothetical protein